MKYWKSLVKFLWKILAGMLVILGVFQWGVKLKVATWVIPDWIVLVVLAIIIAVVGYTAYFVGKYPKVGVGSKPKKTNVDLNEDDAFIVIGLAFNKERRIQRDVLRKLFLEKRKGKNDADFNITLNKLNKLGMVDSSHDFIGTEYVVITSQGLEYCEKFRPASKT